VSFGVAGGCAAVAPPLFIAHAGGAIRQQTYTNSLEALNANYAKGFRFFEMDFAWTADGQLVAIHDWADSFRQTFQVPSGMTVPTLEEFRRLRSRSGLTQLSLAEVLDWARQQGDAVIVTDVKEDNVRALQLLAGEFKAYRQYLIPQVYSYREFVAARQAGFEGIILTLYRMQSLDPVELRDFSLSYAPYAVTMPWQLAQQGLAAYLRQDHIRVYAHTVNELERFFALRKAGVYGVYTDLLVPP
jgi:glycerophosphoryl diester phosphodiesterase